MNRHCWTWQRALQSNDVQTLEDPLVGFQVDKDTFGQNFGPLLHELDGADWLSWLDFFFQPSPLNRTHWEFINNVVREDFTEWAQELGLLPSLREACEGECRTEKQRRMHLPSTNLSTIETKQRKQIESMHSTLERLNRQIEQETCPSKVQKLRDKAQRTLQKLEQLEEIKNEEI